LIITSLLKKSVNRVIFWLKYRFCGYFSFVFLFNYIMVEYSCNKCGKIFNHKANYTRHINRKNSCEETNDQSNTSNKMSTLIEKLEEIHETNKKIIKDNKILKKDNENLKKEIKELKKIKTVNNTNNNTNNGKIIDTDNSNTYILNLNAFGNESIEHFSAKDVKNILNKGFQSIPEYVRLKHFNDDAPENHNVYIPNWRDKTKVLAYDGKTWNLQDRASIMDDLKLSGADFIETHYKDLNPNDKKDMLTLKKLDRFLSSYNDEDIEKTAILHNDIMLVLYNGRKIIEATRKK